MVYSTVIRRRIVTAKQLRLLQEAIIRRRAPAAFAPLVLVSDVHKVHLCMRVLLPTPDPIRGVGDDCGFREQLLRILLFISAFKPNLGGLSLREDGY